MKKNNSNNQNPDDQLQASLSRLEKALRGDSCGYFEEDELEDIIDYYQDEFLLSKAKKAIDFALRLHPDSVPVKARLARHYMQNQQYDKADELIHKLLSIEPENTDVLLCRAEYLLVKGHPDDAKMLFRKIQRLSGDDEENICLDIAYIYMNHELYKEARSFLMEGFAKGGKTDADLCFELAYCDEELKLYDDAVRIYNIILDQDPYSNEAWFSLGKIYFIQGNYQKAGEAYDYAYLTGNDDYQALLNLAHCYFQNGNYDKAIATYQKFASKTGQSSSLLMFIGECYEQKGDLDTAIRYYQQAAQLVPENADVWAGICYCKMEQEKYEEALPLALKALSLNDKSGAFWVYLGDIYENLNNPDKALDAYFKARAFFPDSADLESSIGEIYVYKGECDEALPFLLNAQKLNPDLPELPLLLAVVYYQKGQQDEAIEKLTLAIVKDADNRASFFDLCEDAKTNPKFKHFFIDDENKKKNK